MPKDQKILSILDNDNIPEPAFIKANHKLVKENKDTLKKCKNFRKGLIYLWKTHFDVDLIIEDNPRLVFKSKRKKDIFLVKYS